MFSEERVAQMAAYFLHKRGGRMAYIKLLKLLYLAERKAMAKWGESISGDNFVSMPHGPVLSQTYDLIRGNPSASEMGWNHWIKDESNYEVSLTHADFERDDLDELSDAEIAILDEIFIEYGHMRRFEIVDFTHNHCSEWEDPRGSSFPIRPESIFRAMGKNEDEVRKLIELNITQRQLDAIRNTLK